VGEIGGLPVNGRWISSVISTRCGAESLAKFKMSIDEVSVELARRYFSWDRPGDAGDFNGFSALA